MILFSSSSSTRGEAGDNSRRFRSSILPRQRLDSFGRHSGNSFCPIRSFGNTVLLSGNITPKFIETDSVRGKEILVLQTILNEYVSYRYQHGSIGTRPDGH